MLGALLFVADSVFHLPIPFLREASFVLFGIGAVLTAFGRIRSEFERDREIRNKEREVQDIDAGARENESIRDFLHRHLRHAIVREELTVLRSSKRANALYTMGFILLVISVACPVAAAVMYWRLEPISPNTVSKIAEIKKTLGEVPKDINLSVSRDWRVLLGGITFGFLCLAAARGLLAQQGREMETFFRVGEKVGYYERLTSAIDIRIRQQEKPQEVDSALVDFTVDCLVKPNLGQGSEQNAKVAEKGDEAKEKSLDISPIVKAISEWARNLKI